MVWFDDGEWVPSPRFVQIFEARRRDGRGGQVRRALRLVFTNLFYEEGLPRLSKFHMNVQRLTVQL